MPLYAPRTFYGVVGLLFAINFVGFAPAFYRFCTEYLWYLNPLPTAGKSVAKPNIPDININGHAATSFLFILIYKAQFLVTGPALLYLFNSKAKGTVSSGGRGCGMSLRTKRALHKKLGYVATLPWVAMYALHTVYMVFRFSSAASINRTDSSVSGGLQMWHYWWGLGSIVAALSLLYNSAKAVWVFQEEEKASPGITRKERQRAHINYMISACISFNIPGALRACGMAMQSLVLQRHGGSDLGCDYMTSSGYVTGRGRERGRGREGAGVRGW